MRVLFGFLVLLVLIVGGLLVAPSFIDWGKYQEQGLTQVKELTGYDVNIGGDFAIGFLPAPHVKAQDVTIINPAVSADPLAKFSSLSVGVALAPLFQKQVQVSDITLKKPVFDLRIDREGKGNWLSPEVEALMSKDKGAELKTSGGQQNIAFDNIDIEGGFFRFFDASKGSEIRIEDIDVGLSAKSLNGPFSGQGSVNFGGQAVTFDVDTDAIDKAANALPINVAVDYGPYEVSLKGVAGIAAPFDVQGATKIVLSADALPISDDVTIEGILSANPEVAALKDARVLIGKSAFNGQALVEVKPLNVKAVFEGSDVVDLTKFLPAPKAGKKNADPLLALTEIVPPSITMPQEFSADVSLKTGGLVYGRILLKDTAVKFTKAGKDIKASLKASDIPGSGPAAVDATVAFGSVSESKTGARVYSEPQVSFVVQANTENAGDMVSTLTGLSNLPIVSDARIGKFYIKGNAKTGRFALSDSVVNLDDLKVLLGGSVKQGEAKPVVDFNVSSSVDDPYALAKSLNVDTASWPKNLGEVALSADLKGTMDNLSTDATVSAFGANVTVSGKLDELMSGSALDNLAVRIQHANLAQLLKNVGASAPAYAEMSKPIDASFVVGMDGKLVKLSNIKAKVAGTDMAGALSYDGGGSKPSVSGDLRFTTLSLQNAGGGGAKSSGGSSSGSSSGGRWSSAPIDTGFLHGMNARFDIAGERLIYDRWDVTKPTLKVVLQNGALDVQDLEGGLFGGQVAVQSKLSSTAPSAPLNSSVNANIQNVDIGKLANALSGSKRLQGEGTVSLNVNVQGAGASQKALISSLGGGATLQGTDVVLKGFDLAGLASALLDSNKPLPRIKQLVSASSSGGETAFDTVDGQYAIQSGVASITSMQMDGPAASITSKGGASLPAWTIDTVHTITLKNAPEVEPFDVTIKGPLDNPGNTFGKGLFDTYLNEKLGEKIHDLVGDDVGNVLSKFGLIPAKKEKAPVSANDNAEPAAGNEEQAVPSQAQPIQQQPRQKTQEEQAQEAIEGVLRGLFQ